VTDLRGVFESLLLLIARTADRELARLAQYLKAENRLLRGKLPKRVEVTPRGVIPRRPSRRRGG
jgi:putative transposase